MLFPEYIAYHILMLCFSYRLVQDPEVRKATGMHPRMGLQLALRSGPGGVMSLNEPFYVAY